jgi:CspA family cold shock protein
MEGYKTLKAGQEVSFDLAEGQKGLHASNIMPLANHEEVTPTEPESGEHLENGNN